MYSSLGSHLPVLSLQVRIFVGFAKVRSTSSMRRVRCGWGHVQHKTQRQAPTAFERSLDKAHSEGCDVEMTGGAHACHSKLGSWHLRSRVRRVRDREDRHRNQVQHAGDDGLSPGLNPEAGLNLRRGTQPRSGTQPEKKKELLMEAANMSV